MNNKDQILAFSLDLATKAHINQKRNDGSPYINHIIAVAEITKSYRGKYIYSDDLIIILQILAHHDHSEDLGIPEEEIINTFIDNGFIIKDSPEYNLLTDSLYLLNKHHFDSYFHYIMAIKENFLASLVKRADLTHNLSDLKPGTLRDKYELAKWILEN